MLTIPIVNQIRTEDWFVTIDLNDDYFHVWVETQHSEKCVRTSSENYFSGRGMEFSNNTGTYVSRTY